MRQNFFSKLVGFLCFIIPVYLFVFKKGQAKKIRRGIFLRLLRDVFIRSPKKLQVVLDQGRDKCIMKMSKATTSGLGPKEKIEIKGEFMNFSIVVGDCLERLKAIPDKSIHFVVTDPPYFIDGMDDDWDKSSLTKKTAKAGVIGSLPVGMKFDPAAGKKLQEFMSKVSKECHRVLKPGGFFVAFSQARLYHRLAVAVEDAGFEIRDMLGWNYEGQAKAFSMDHFINNMVKKNLITEERGNNILASIDGRKTPQLKPQIEPMVLAQKPKDGTFVDNWMAHEVGLVDVTQTLDGKFPGNIMRVPKPTVLEKGNNNDHPTVKPVTLIEHLIKLFTKSGQTVLDPFLGSGSHGVAALKAGRKFIGIEINKDYAKISQQRMNEVCHANV